MNIVPTALIDAMNITSAHFSNDVDEFEKASLTKASCLSVDCPRIAESPIAMECRLRDIIALEATDWVMGDVVAFHIADECVKNGKIDVTHYQPVARLGYKEYATINDVFELERP